MKHLFLVAVAAAFLTPLVSVAQIRVAVEDGSGSGSGAGIVAQLNDDTWADFTATLVTAGDIDTLGELANYDVVILGGSGSNNADWTLDMANAVSQFVANGGAAVLTGWGNHDMQGAPADSVLDNLFPTQNLASTNEFDDNGATLVITQAHPITAGLSDFVIANGCCTELNTLALEPDDVELATMDGYTVVAVKEFGLGVSVYLGPIYMASAGYSSMFPALREGNPDRLLEQAVAWASGAEGSGLLRATFHVTKTFSDGREDEVDVHLSCNSGLPLEQDFTIAGGDPGGVRFVVTEIQGTETVCEVTESGGPDGYTPVFNGGSGCTWENVVAGFYRCEISNEANPAEFTVTKDWVIEGAVGEEVILEAQVTINCSRDILAIDDYEITEPDGSVTANLSGDGDSVTVTVDTTLGSTSCSAYESIYQTGVETDNGCGARTITAGGSSSCTITNTVFFEGIPTLSQYGMALLALLMLGLGFVGLRRFV